MTASIVIINTSNHDEDITIDMDGKHVATIERGSTHKIGFGGRPLNITATAQKPKGNEYLGELVATAVPVVEKPGLPGLDFGDALAILKRGGRVQRKGWNGKDMRIWLDKHIGPGQLPCFVMLTAEGAHQPGWLASQADMLAEDWIEVEVDGFGGWKPKPFGDAVGYVS